MNPTVPPSATPPPVVIQQKKGPGCWGIGCAIVLLVLLLIGGLLAGLNWYFKKEVGSYISSSPTTTQTFDGGDTMFHATEQKIADFSRAVQTGKTATLELSADEINTLFARDPAIQDSKIKAFVTMTGTQGHLAASLPGNLIPVGFLKDSYINGSADLSPTFEPTTKSIVLNLKSLTIGNQQVPPDQLSTMEAQFQPFITMQIQQSPGGANFFDHLQSMEIRDGKLVLESQ